MGYFDEKWKFKTAIKQLPFNIKNDDAMTDARLTAIAADIQLLEQALYTSDGTPKPQAAATAVSIDAASMAQFYLVNEIMRNVEVHFMKSCYMVFDSRARRLKAGAVWDMDSSCYECDTQFWCKDELYFDALFLQPAFVKNVRKLVAALDTAAVATTIDDMATKLAPAAALDAERWGEHADINGAYRGDFAAAVAFVKSVVTTRIAWLKAVL